MLLTGKGGYLVKETISKEKAESIFLENSGYVYRIALYLTRSKEMADDITQETFIQAILKYDRFDPERSLRPWLYKIALNITRNMLRKQKWLKFLGRLPETEYVDLLEASMLKSEEEKEVWRQINGLSFKSREVLVLHFFSGFKLKEISETLGIPLGTCKSRINSALETLRKRIPQEEFVNILTNGGEYYETV